MVRQSDCKIDPVRDEIRKDGQKITQETFRYYMLNKPAGYLSATEDRFRPVVLELLPEPERKGLFPVGRLDVDTEGLLLLTNDGALAHGLLSPKRHVDKTYAAQIQGVVTQEDVLRFREGLDIGEKKLTMPARLEILEDPQGDPRGRTRVQVTIQEGKFHQVKRMFDAVGKQVIHLKRISMGSLKLDKDLESGMYRRLSEAELADLREIGHKNVRK